MASKQTSKTNGKKEATFTRDKQTKNKYRFTCPSDEPGADITGSIYIAQEDLPDPAPATITVSVSF